MMKTRTTFFTLLTTLTLSSSLFAGQISIINLLRDYKSVGIDSFRDQTRTPIKVEVFADKTCNGKSWWSTTLNWNERIPNLAPSRGQTVNCVKVTLEETTLGQVFYPNSLKIENLDDDISGNIRVYLDSDYSIPSYFTSGSRTIVTTSGGPAKIDFVVGK